jgi:hypothetical protein
VSRRPPPQVGPKSESAYQLMEALFTRGGRVATPLRSMQQQPQDAAETEPAAVQDAAYAL